jgi:hypothetical protein
MKKRESRKVFNPWVRIKIEISFKEEWEKLFLFIEINFRMRVV